MADLATIGFKADTSELISAKSALTGLVPAAASAEKASEKLANAVDKTAVAETKAVTATETLKAAASGAATSLNLEATAAGKAASANDNLARSATGATRAAQGLVGQTGNIAAQFNDIGVSLAGGQSPFLIALQQGTQLNQVFGGQGLGAILKGVAAGFMSIISPVSLLTIGIIALGGYGVQAFMDWISAGDTAKLSLEDQNKLIIAIAQSWGEAVPAIQEYVAALEAAKNSADAVQTIETLRTKLTKDTTEQIEKMNVSYAQLYQNLIDVGGISNDVMGKLPDAFSNLRDKVAEGKSTQEDFNTVLNLLNDASLKGVTGVDGFITSIKTLMTQALETTKAVSVMSNTIGQAAAAKSAAQGLAGGVTSDVNTNPFDDLPMFGPRPTERPLIELQGLEDQNKVVQAIAKSWADTVPSVQQYVTSLEAANQSADVASAIETIRSQMVAETANSVANLNSEFEQLYQSMLDTGNVSSNVIGQLPEAFETLRSKVEEGKATQEDFNNVLNLVSDASASGVAGVDGFISAIKLLMGQALQTSAAVAQMSAQISAAGNAALNNPAFGRGAGNPNANADGPIIGNDYDLPMDGPRIQSRPLIELEGTPWIHGGGKAKGGGGAGSTKQTTTELQELNQALQALNEPFSQATTAYGTLQTALKNGVIDNDEYQASLEAIQEAFMKTGGSSDQWAQIMTNNGKKVADSSKEWSGLVKGFVSDLVGGLRQGKSIWESFGDAVNNVLDKIIDKLLNQFIDAIFTSNKAAGGIGGGAAGGGGGIFGSILGWFGGLFSAKGNVFDSGVSAFAKGGSFSNSVVSGPTAFAFGKGGANLGIMGEAGPEAVMPLKRGPNGSLGVQMHGGQAANQNSITIAPMINVEGSSGNEAQDQKQAGRISDAVIDGIQKIVDERMLVNTGYGGILKPRGYGGN